MKRRLEGAFHISAARGNVGRRPPCPYRLPPATSAPRPGPRLPHPLFSRLGAAGWGGGGSPGRGPRAPFGREGTPVQLPIPNLPRMAPSFASRSRLSDPSSANPPSSRCQPPSVGLPASLPSPPLPLRSLGRGWERLKRGEGETTLPPRLGESPGMLLGRGSRD